MFIKNKLFFLLTIILFLSGCATMNKSECLSADWKIIGMEDGAEGRLTSYLGEHRSACAPYNVTPSLNTYLVGHRAGIQQYCTPSNGYNVGEQGKKYQGVCPSELEGPFLQAYEHGYEHYALKSELYDIESSIRYKHNKIHNLIEEISQLEKQIISDQTNEARRRELLENVKNCQSQISYLETDIYALGREEVLLHDRLEVHNLHHNN